LNGFYTKNTNTPYIYKPLIPTTTFQFQQIKELETIEKKKKKKKKKKISRQEKTPIQLA